MTEIELILTIVKQTQNHIAIINQELGGVQTDVAVLKSQVGELMWLTRLLHLPFWGCLLRCFSECITIIKTIEGG